MSGKYLSFVLSTHFRIFGRCSGIPCNACRSTKVRFQTTEVHIVHVSTPSVFTVGSWRCVRGKCSSVVLCSVRSIPINSIRNERQGYVHFHSWRSFCIQSVWRSFSFCSSEPSISFRVIRSRFSSSQRYVLCSST